MMIFRRAAVVGIVVLDEETRDVFKRRGVKGAPIIIANSPGLTGVKVRLLGFPVSNSRSK